MFIVGVAMPFSFGKRWEHGESWSRTFLHVLRRSLTLFFLGVLLHCYYAGKPVWELWNVLTQLSVTYMVAFLFMRKPLKTQIIASFAILLGNYLAYRFIPAPGIGDDPWLKDHNLGSFMDMALMGKINNGGGWVAINVIGSSAHTMWGVVAGTVLRSSRPAREKLRLIAIAGVIGVVLGVALDPVTPIVKRICTSSFIVESGGWALLALAFFYWLVDVRGARGWTKPLVIYGMSPIFIYMFVNFFGSWTNNFIDIFMKSWLDSLGVAGNVLRDNLRLLVYFYLMYWLYKNKIVVKI
jgi:predicted acyltransferase